MITIITCTTADAPALAALWNAKTLEAGSCWYQAPAVDADYVTMLLDSGYTFALASVDGTSAGFAFWRGAAGALQLVALAATADDVSYELVAAHCDAGLAAGATAGWTELTAGPSVEKTRMDTLALAYTTIEWTSLASGDDPDSRTPLRYRVDYDLASLAAKLDELLGGGA